MQQDSEDKSCFIVKNPVNPVLKNPVNPV